MRLSYKGIDLLYKEQLLLSSEVEQYSNNNNNTYHIQLLSDQICVSKKSNLKTLKSNFWVNLQAYLKLNTFAVCNSVFINSI